MKRYTVLIYPNDDAIGRGEEGESICTKWEKCRIVLNYEWKVLKSGFIVATMFFLILISNLKD